MAEQWIFLDAALVALALHHVNGIVQYSFDEEIAQLGHQDMRPWKITQCDGQRANVIVMAVGNGNRIEFLILYKIKLRQSTAAFPFRVDSGVEQQSVVFGLHKP